jgi:hypothetical protein
MDKKGRMCLDHGARWRQYISEIAARHTSDELLLAATEWLMNATTSLLGRHRLKHQGIVTKWDKSWIFWPHGIGADAMDKTFVPAVGQD